MRGIKSVGDDERDVLAGVVNEIVGEGSAPLGGKVAAELVGRRRDRRKARGKACV